MGGSHCARMHPKVLIQDLPDASHAAAGTRGVGDAFDSFRVVLVLNQTTHVGSTVLSRPVVTTFSNITSLLMVKSKPIGLEPLSGKGKLRLIE